MKSDELMLSVKHPKAYREVGHDVFYRFAVLRSDYWLRFGILKESDIGTYETLQFLYESSIPFTLEFLAEKSKCSMVALQQRLDNLENAELLKTLKANQQSEPNILVLIAPKLSLEKDFQRLKCKVKKNHAKQLRELQGKQSKSLFHKIKLAVEKNIGLAK